MTQGVGSGRPSEDLAALGRVHVVGIGGAGMSGIARIMLARGVPVSGSDAKDSRRLAALRALGADVAVGHDAARVAAADTVWCRPPSRTPTPSWWRPASGGSAS